MKGVDPYEMVGVARDADDDAIRAGYRAKSKILHPDAGGTEAEFSILKECRDLLLDVERRRRYDETGEFDDKTVNNDRGAAITIIFAKMSAAIDRWVASDFNPVIDPARVDMVKMAREDIEEDRQRALSALADGRKNLYAIERVVKRIRRKDAVAGENVLAAAFGQQIESTKARLNAIEDAIRMLVVALEVLDDFEFEVDGSESPYNGRAGTTSFSINLGGGFERLRSFHGI